MKRVVDPDGFFLLRTPLLAFDDLAALGTDRAGFEEGLRALLARSEVRDALRLASPDLDEHLRPWLDGEAPAEPKLVRAGLRYAARMCARPTPFGLMAGMTLGELGSTTQLELAPLSEARRRTTIEPNFVTALAEELSGDPAVRRALRFRPSTSLYEAAGRWRYARARTEGARRRYELVAADGGMPLRTVVERARDGATVAELVEVLVGHGAQPEAAEGYVGALIDAQILEGDLVPPVTGAEPAAAFAERLETVPVPDGIRAALGTARAALAQVDAGGLGPPPEAYDDVMAALAALPVDHDPKRSLVTELVKPAARAELGRDVVAEIARVTEQLVKTVPRRRNDALATWRGAFIARWEDREVPVVEALDEELGIGFERSGSPSADGSPLLRALPWPAGDAEPTAWGPAQSHLLRRIGECGDELVLDDADWAALELKEHAELPDSIGALVTIAAGPDGFRLRHQGSSGPSGARLLGRVCHAVPGLEDAVREHLRREEALRPDAVFAEIVHLPEGKTGKLIARPVLRDHELAFLGRSGSGAALGVDDLLVSVRGERIVLRSRSLGKEIVPRLSSAQNYNYNSLGLFRFLCALQAQGVAEGVSWQWGPLESAPFLPRVVSGRTVLDRARWLVTRDELADAVAADDDAARSEAIAALREARGLPRWVAVADGDNELALDLEAVVAQDTLVRLAAPRAGIRLVELWPAPEDLCVTGPGGRYANEIVVPFTRRRSAIAPAPRGPRPATAQRRFLPGGEWLYAKLYTGTATADALLREMVAPLVADAEQWFFLRYGDPDWHVRLRIHGDPVTLLPALHAAAQAEAERGRLWRMTLDTYEREQERYGGPAGVALCEELFHADSVAVLELLALTPGDAGADLRWRLALAGIDRLLDDVLDDDEMKAATMRRMRGAYAAEHRADGALRGAVGERFRAEREALAPLLDGEADGVLAEGLAVLDRRSAAMAPTLERLRELGAAGELEADPGQLAADLAHMHANRLLRSAQRAHEMVIYDVLDRLHAARAARARA